MTNDMPLMNFASVSELSKYAWKCGVLYVHIFDQVPDDSFVQAFDKLEPFEQLIGLRFSRELQLFKELEPPYKRPCLTAWAGSPLMTIYSVSEIPKVRKYAQDTFHPLLKALVESGKAPPEWKHFVAH